MKKMPKKLFDEFIDLSRNYWDSGEHQLLTDRSYLSHNIEKITGIDWLSVQDLVDAIIRFRAFLPNAENEVIYNVLRVLGWEVVDDGEEEHLAG